MPDVCELIIKTKVSEICKVEDLVFNFERLEDIRQAVCDLQNDETKIRLSTTGTVCVCIGDTIQLYAILPTEYQAGAMYSWTGPDSFNDSSQNPSFVAAAVKEGLYTVTVTVPGFDTFSQSIYVDVKCCATCTINSVEDPQSKPSSPCEGSWYVDLVNSTTEIYCMGVWVPLPAALMDDPSYVSGTPIVCLGDTIYLYGFGGASYAWTGPDSFGSVLQSPEIALSSDTANIATKSGNYECVITRADGSTTTRGVFVQVINCPAPIGIVDADCEP